MLKRLVAAASVSAIAVLGVVPAASAAPGTHHRHVKVVKAIDWDAPSPTAPGGVTIQRSIDWD